MSGGRTINAVAVRVRASRTAIAFDLYCGYLGFVIGASVPFLRDEPVPPAAFELGLICAAFPFGMVAGLALWGSMADRLGRATLLVLGLVVLAGGALASALVAPDWRLAGLRLLLGAGSVVYGKSMRAYGMQVIPPSSNAWVPPWIAPVLWLVGGVLATGLALAIGPLAGTGTWRWLLGAAAVAVLPMLVARTVLPEAPLWLLERGRRRQLAELTRALGLPPPGEAPRTAVVGEMRTTAGVGGYSTILALHGIGNAGAAIGGVILLSGYGLAPTDTLALVLTAQLLVLLALWVGSRVIDRVDRRRMVVWMSLTSCLAGVGVAWLGPESPAVLALYFALYAFLTWLTGTALYPGRRTRPDVPPNGARVDVTLIASLAGNGICEFLTAVLVPRFGLTTMLLCVVAYLGAALVALRGPDDWAKVL